MRRYVGLGKESSFGQAASITRYVDPVTFSLTPEKEPIILRTVASRSPVRFYSGKIVVTGEVEIPLYPDVIGDFLLMLLGKVSSAQLAQGVFEHTFTPIEKHENPVTYTLEAGMDTVARRVLGVILESMSMELTPGEAPTAACSILGVNETTASLTTPSFPTVPPFPENSAQITLNGAAAELRALSLEINNNPSTDHFTIGSRTLTRHELGDLEITGSMDIRLADRTHLDEFLNDTQGSLEIKFTGATISESYSYQLTITLPKIIYTTWSAEVSGSEAIIQSIEFAAIKPPDQPIITVKLINATSGY